MTPPISIYGDSNEASHGRLAELAAAVIGDRRFELKGTGELITDLRFEAPDWAMNVELKAFTGDDSSDFLASILSGHAWDQCRSMRRAREPGCFLVLGNRKDLREAIIKSTRVPRNGKKPDVGNVSITYSNLVKDFRRNCDCLGIRTFLIGEPPWFNDTRKSVWENLLHYVYKMSTEGDPFAHMPRWSDDEAEIGALIDRIRGLGKVRATEINRHYMLRLVPRNGDTVPLEKLFGIGPKTAKLIAKELMA